MLRRIAWRPLFMRPFISVQSARAILDFGFNPEILHRKPFQFSGNG